MKTFEQQLADSARRLRDADNYRLPAPPRRPRRRLSWGWVATPAAAVAGLLLGVSLPRQADMPAPPQLAEARTADTVVELRTVRDTVYLPAPAAPARPQGRTQAAPPAEGVATTLPARLDTGGCNVHCDGVDYTLLVNL